MKEKGKMKSAKVWTSLLFTFSLLLLTSSAQAAEVDGDSTRMFYLALEGIEGESGDRWHEKWIELLSLKRGSSESEQTDISDIPVSGGSEAFVFKHLVDSATPKIQEASTNGTRIASGWVEFCHTIDSKQYIAYLAKLEGIKIVKAKVEYEELSDGTIAQVETADFEVEKCTWETSYCKVLVGAHSHMSAAWTSGNGSVTNDINGTIFLLPSGTSAVRVIFTADEGYEIVGENVVNLGTVTANVAFGEESGYKVPEVNAVPLCTVTVGTSANMSAVWTSGDGAVTNAINGTAFKVKLGTTGVRVVFTPEHGYRFVKAGETGVRPLPSPVIGDCTVEVPVVEEILSEVTFAVGAGIRHAAYVCGGVTNELVTEETVAIVQLGTRIELIVEELPRYYPFAGERTFTVEQETMRVEIFASPIPKGMEGNPFQIGADVFAVTNAEGVLTITGTGAMDDFASAADVPWVSATVTKVTVDASVTQIGANAWSGMGNSVAINGTALSAVRYLAPGIGYVQPVGAISGAEFERVEIVDGKAYLGVSVYTNSEVKVIGVGEGWGVATNSVIEVPAPGKQGFFYLMSKPATKVE